MSRFLEGGPLIVVSGIPVMLGLQPTVLIMALICAALGAMILSRFTRSLGSLTYPVNFLALLTGAILANVLMKRVRLPLDYAFERPLMISIGGMIAASLITLLLMARDRESD